MSQEQNDQAEGTGSSLTRVAIHNDVPTSRSEIEMKNNKKGIADYTTTKTTTTTTTNNNNNNKYLLGIKYCVHTNYKYLDGCVRGWCIHGCICGCVCRHICWYSCRCVVYFYYYYYYY
mmetsp:Transcript_20298/g.22798  ORF Transcript_20298/g.22798 Transcript_20298/m.22798 type:complete len:118 (-) Transcript_20298:24-377(-)